MLNLDEKHFDQSQTEDIYLQNRIPEQYYG